MFGRDRRPTAIPEPAPTVVPEQEDRRRPAPVCASCLRWRAQLIYLDNGLDYCVDCAKSLETIYGRTPAGKRDADLTSLDGVRDPGPATTGDIVFEARR